MCASFKWVLQGKFGILIAYSFHSFAAVCFLTQQRSSKILIETNNINHTVTNKISTRTEWSDKSAFIASKQPQRSVFNH